MVVKLLQILRPGSGENFLKGLQNISIVSPASIRERVCFHGKFADTKGKITFGSMDKETCRMFESGAIADEDIFYVVLFSPTAFGP